MFWTSITWCFLFFSGDFQQFDISSEEEAEEKVVRRASSKTKRTKECPGCGANVALSTKECRFCDYQFTSKSLLVNQQSAAQESQAIRDRFPFEPERVRTLHNSLSLTVVILIATTFQCIRMTMEVYSFKLSWADEFAKQESVGLDLQEIFLFLIWLLWKVVMNTNTW